MKKRGLSLTELLVVIVVGAVGLVAVTSLIFESYKDWNTSKQRKSLQEELDLAGFTIKGVLEEAKTVSILDSGPTTGTRIQASHDTDWVKEFYPQGSDLIIKDVKNGNTTRAVMNCLASLSFLQDSTTGETAVRVSLSATRASRTLTNSFVVYLRNKG